MSEEVVCTTPEEEYEDDFHNDLDWLIKDENRSEDQGLDFDDIEAKIDKELEEDDKQKGKKRKPKSQKEEKIDKRTEELEEDVERWPSPMDPFEYDSDRDCPNKSQPIAPPPPRMDEQTEEEKKYIMEKIQQANQDLHDQEAPDMTRRRRLHFKETLVDLVVPPQQDGNSGEVEGEQGIMDSEAEMEVSGKLSELKLSPREESVRSGRTGETCDGGVKQGRFLVEKDGEFDLVSLKEVESQGLLPPIANSSSPRHQQQTVSSSKTQRSSSCFSPRTGSSSLHHQQQTVSSTKTQRSSSCFSPRTGSSSLHHQQQTVSSTKTQRSSSCSSPRTGSSLFQQGIDHLRAPKPPTQPNPNPNPNPNPQPRNRPRSASHSRTGEQKSGPAGESQRRVLSATGTPSQATYALSPQQKELVQRIQERKEKLAREEEQRKLEEEEQKRQENKLVFKAWLMRKREHFQEEKRIKRAQEMEKMSSKKDSNPSEDCFRLWLRRKQQQQQKERQLVELKRLEEDPGYLLRSREECERAFRLWLKRKQEEKRAEQQAARELSRRLLREERRSRRNRDLLCSINETKPFRFTEQMFYYF